MKRVAMVCRCMTCRPDLHGYKVPGVGEQLPCLSENRGEVRLTSDGFQVIYHKMKQAARCDIVDCECLLWDGRGPHYFRKQVYDKRHDEKWLHVMELSACDNCFGAASVDVDGFHASAVANCWRCENCFAIFNQWLAEWDKRLA